MRGSITRTIRLGKDTDAILRKIADEEAVSASFLVSRAVKKFVEWDAHADKFGFVDMPSSVVLRMMNYLSDDDEARELGRWVGRNFVREFLTFWFKKLDIGAILAGFPKLVAQYTNAFEYEEHHEGSRYTIVLKHGKGPKWSVYYEEVVKCAFEDILAREVKIDRFEDQVVIRFNLT